MKVENYSNFGKKTRQNVALIWSPPKLTKVPKVETSKVDRTPSNNVIMEKFEKIEEKLGNYESSNEDMKEAIDGLNSKLDKILGLLTKNGGKMNESNPVRLFSDFLACQGSKTEFCIVDFNTYTFH